MVRFFSEPTLIRQPSRAISARRVKGQLENRLEVAS
jgi:hypothetical protein